MFSLLHAHMKNTGFLFQLRLYVQVVFYKLCIAPFRIYRRRPYDPWWLVELAEEQLPEESWLSEALRKCTRASGSPPYIHFVSACQPNKPNSEWQFDMNLSLEHPEYGELILDILKGHRVGGVEFLGLLLRDG